MAELRRIAKRTVIIEIMDPSQEGWWGRLRRRYYDFVTKEPTGNFLGLRAFDDLMSSENRVERFNVRTIRGVYQFAIFTN